ncbi:FAD-dependent oxidoreductase [Oerskovia turbata]
MTSTDVVVHGATAAGVCAAVAAARSGVRVLLVEPGQHVGGMTSGGLGYTDLGDPRVVGGPAARFRADVAAHYGVAEGRYAGPEPHVAEAILTRWLEEAGVEVLLGRRLEHAVVRHDGPDGPRIVETRVRAAHGAETIAGQVFVDATYEGDLLDAAGVPSAIGREDVALHGESYAGRREIFPGMHNMPPGLSPFRGPGRTGGLLPQIKPEPLAPVGSGDGGVMSYGYRVCLTRAPDRVEIARRPGYDPDHWELGRRLFDHWRRHGVDVPAGRLLGLEQNLPGGKCDANSLGPFSLSVLDGSAWAYPAAGHDERERIRLRHLHHAQDFLYFLSADDAVPRAVRDELARWGLPRDEFADTGHLPHQLYVREARRMAGQHVLTQHDLLGARPQPDVVAMGSYHLDVREVQRAWRDAPEHPDPVPGVVTEGYLSVRVPPYPIPYRSLVPRPQDCANLLVPVCVSASHVAFSSIRMEVQYQMLGWAAGRAAAQAVAGALAVQRIDVGGLQDMLREDGQVLSI